MSLDDSSGGGRPDRQIGVLVAAVATIVLALVIAWATDSDDFVAAPTTTTGLSTTSVSGAISSATTSIGLVSTTTLGSESTALGDLVPGVIDLPVDRYPTDVAFAGSRFWVIAGSSTPEPGQPPASDGYVLGVDVENGTVDVEVALSDAPVQLVADSEAVWVTHWETGAVSRIDPETGAVVATIPLELPFDFGGDEDNFLFIPSDVVIGHGAVWVSTARGAVARIDQDSNRLQDIYDIPGNDPLGGLEVGPDGVWVEADAGGVVHISTETGAFSKISREMLGHRGMNVFIPGGETGDGMYVAGTDDEAYTDDTSTTVSRIDLETREAVGSTELSRQVVHLGWLNGFVGVLDDRGVFTHLSEIPRLGSQINYTSWSGGAVSETFREAWEIDTDQNRLVRVDETGGAAVELPFEVDDGAGGRRPIPEELEVSKDWVARDPGPLVPGSASALWTGEQLVFWGGDALGTGLTRTSGAAYTPETGEWTLLSDGPVPNASEAVWTGGELIVWSGIGTAGAWTPETNAWRVIEDWPLTSSYYRLAVWTGDGILDAGSGLAVNPADGSSTSIAEPPPLHERASVVWVDGHVVSVTGEGAYELAADDWVEMPGSPLTPLAVSGVPLDGSVFAADYEMSAAQYDPADNNWSELPDVPLRFYECAPDVHAFRAGALVEHCAGTAIWDPVDAMWMPVTHPRPTPAFPPSILTTGDRLYAWGDGFYEFVGDPEQPSRLAVGISVFDVPGGWSVSSVMGEGDVVEVVIESSADGVCTIVAAHVGAEGFLQSHVTEATTATQILPYVGGDPVDALAVADGVVDDRHHLIWAPGTTDAIDLACSSQRAAQEIAPRIWSPRQ